LSEYLAAVARCGFSSANHEIIHERWSPHSDLLGDGVNIASRLQSIADANGLVISSTVHEQVRETLPIPFVNLGGQRRSKPEPVNKQNCQRKYCDEDDGLRAYVLKVDQRSPHTPLRHLPDRSPPPSRSTTGSRGCTEAKRRRTAPTCKRRDYEDRDATPLRWPRRLGRRVRIDALRNRSPSRLNSCSWTISFDRVAMRCRSDSLSDSSERSESSLFESAVEAH
jgi:hypothetical protein